MFLIGDIFIVIVGILFFVSLVALIISLFDK